jgi:hypothetical protein
MIQQQIIDDFAAYYATRDNIDRHRLRAHVVGLTQVSNKQSRRTWSSLLARIDEIEGGER